MQCVETGARRPSWIIQISESAAHNLPRRSLDCVLDLPSQRPSLILSPLLPLQMLDPRLLYLLRRRRCSVSRGRINDTRVVAGITRTDIRVRVRTTVASVISPVV